VEWSLRAYILVLAIASIISAVSHHAVEIIDRISVYVIVFSTMLTGYPLLAIPLMLHIIAYTGEKPTRKLYRDFNTACITVSRGTLLELALTAAATLYNGDGAPAVILSSLALGNLAALTLILTLTIILLQTITTELENLLST